MGVVRWTGRETKALRLAMRMTVRKFAAHIGVSDRMVSKWERGGTDVVPRQGTQAALDTTLAMAGAEAQERFASLITEQAATTADPRTESLLASDTRRYRRHPADGKLMVLIEEGMYLSGPSDEPRWLPSYWLDVFPTRKHWSAGGRAPDSLREHPVVWVTWHDAAAYAAWAGKTLPSARQWEKAARGPHGSPYPWGSAATAAKCNVRESGIGRTTPVDRYQSGASPLGAFDLCGNVWEWTSTPSRPGRHELKGSAFTSPFSRAAPSHFNDASSAMSDDDTGFRCVVTATPS
jgi:transcriptional regulator with XRE-family HTH domain